MTDRRQHDPLAKTDAPEDCGGVCRYVGSGVRARGIRRALPHRSDLASNWYWRCSCGAYCGTHPNILPLGSPAGPETRRAREAAHAAFDPLWRRRMEISGLQQKDARNRGYRWLAAELGIKRRDCHIGAMDKATAGRVVEICGRVRTKDHALGETQS